MFQQWSLKSSHPYLLPQSPKVCLLHLCLFCCLAYRIAISPDTVQVSPHPPKRPVWSSGKPEMPPQGASGFSTHNQAFWASIPSGSMKKQTFFFNPFLPYAFSLENKNIIKNLLKIKDRCVTKFGSLNHQPGLPAPGQSAVELESRASWLHLLSIPLITGSASFILSHQSSFLGPNLSPQMLRSLVLPDDSLCLSRETEW